MSDAFRRLLCRLSGHRIGPFIEDGKVTKSHCERCGTRLFTWPNLHYREPTP